MVSAEVQQRARRRTPAHHLRGRALAPALVGIAALGPTLALATGCGGGDASPGSTAAAPLGRVLAARAPVAALAPLPGGALLAGPLSGGPLLRISADGRARRSPLRVPPVSTDGQRGLLSLAVARGRVYASWTTPAPAERLLVGELRRDAPPRLVWRGLATTTLANGGHLAFAPDGRLTIGIGDRQSPRGAVGRMLALDPAGAPSQRPRVLSTGWNNPFAFAFAPDGTLWVADNAPGRTPERLARGDAGVPRDVTDLPDETAPSGLAVLPDGDLALCGVVSGTLDRWHRDADGAWRRVATLARGCRYGVVRLTDGRSRLRRRESDPERAAVSPAPPTEGSPTA